jgi:hypothetical protein
MFVRAAMLIAQRRLWFGHCRGLRRGVVLMRGSRMILLKV